MCVVCAQHVYAYVSVNGLLIHTQIMPTKVCVHEQYRIAFQLISMYLNARTAVFVRA